MKLFNRSSVLASAVLLCASMMTPIAQGRDKSSVSPIGAPVTLHAPSPVSREIAPILPGLDDAFNPVEAAPAGRRLAAAPLMDDQAEQPESSPVSQRLAEINVAQRGDAHIAVEPLGALTEDQTAACQQLELLWNSGQTQAALNLLEALEQEGAQLAIGVDWQQAQQMSSRIAGDIRVGAPRTDGSSMVLDYDAGTGNLFAVVQWNDQWSVNISYDGGATWLVSFEWFGGVLVDVDAAVVSGYVYVGYVDSGTPSDGRLRRCFVADGSVDGVYFFETIITGVPTLNDICIAGNVDNFNNRIYYGALLSDNTIQWHWDDSLVGTAFINNSPVVSAASGLDAHWSQDATMGYWVFLSYVGTDGAVHVARWTGSAWTDLIVDTTFTGSHPRTAVSAHGDTVICAYEESYATGQGIKYMISYNAGGTWLFGDLIVPPAGGGQYQMVDVTARGGAGTAVIYTREVGEPDQVFFQRRAGYAPGGWAGAEQINDYDVTTGYWTAINWLPHSGGAATTTLETVSQWDGTSTVGSFGETNTATYAQTFTVAGPTTMNGFSLYIDDNLNPDWVEFDAFVGRWDTVNNRVHSLLNLTGPYATTNNGGAGGLELFNFNTGELILDPAHTYVFGVIASNQFDGSLGTGRMGVIADPNTYLGGDFVYLNNGSNFNNIFTNAFTTTWGGDLAFELDLTEAWSYGMMYLNGTGIPYFNREEAPIGCPEDLVAPTGVEQQDLNAVLNRWGDPNCLPGGSAYPCPEDLVIPAGVEQQDLNAVLNRWGDPACE